MILYHGHEQLKSWGINRNYLKYIEGMITREEMRKDLKSHTLRNIGEHSTYILDDPNKNRSKGVIDENDGYEFPCVNNVSRCWPSYAN